MTSFRAVVSLVIIGTACVSESTTGPTAPRPLLSASDQTFFVAMSGGAYHTCGITIGLVAFCWGGNFSGQLGDGTSTDRLTPAAVAGGLRFIALSASPGDGFFTCGVTLSGAAWCWGDNITGQLGDGTTSPSLSPVAVTGGRTFVALSSGAVHTCALTSAGAAYCWGQGLVGQMGNGTATSSASPVAVSGGLKFVRISADGSHTCGLTGTGTAYCWGLDNQGQLGTGGPAPEGCGPLGIPCSTLPVAVAGGLRFFALTTGRSYACGLTWSGAAYCWGQNDSGELGDGTTTDRPSPVAVTGDRRFFTLSAGQEHTCGLTLSGVAYCWGSNFFGQMGLGAVDFGPHPGPLPVTGGLKFFAVTAGRDHTCGLTAAFPPRAYCWGSNRFGQVGDGTSGTANMRPSPVPVLGP